MEKTLPINEMSLIGTYRSFAKKSHRIFEIDLIRGLFIWGMCFDHFMGNFWFLYPYIFGAANGGVVPEWVTLMDHVGYTYWVNPYRETVRYFGLFILLIVCGISCKFSKNNAKRGLMVIVGGTIIGLAMAVFSQLSNTNYNIVMPTLFCIGLCILTYTLFKFTYTKIYNAIQKKNYLKTASAYELAHAPYKYDDNPKGWKWWCLAFAIIFFGVNLYLKFTPEFCSFDLDGEKQWYDYFLIFSGQHSRYISIDNYEGSALVGRVILVALGANQYGSDWLPIFPFVCYIFIGGFIGETLYRNKETFLRFFYKKKRFDENGFDRSTILNDKLYRWLSPIIYPGQHTIYVYFLHQVFWVLLMCPIYLACGMEITLFG